jgi:ketosteroid isomerase-like protein
MRLRSSVFVIALAVLLAAPASGLAADTQAAAVLAPVRQFVDGVNKGDLKSAVAACTSPSSVIDDFPPHEWQGPTACADWARAFSASAKSAGITQGNVTLGTPWHVAVTGDRAYVVVPARYTYKLRGAPVTESGSIFTLALKKLPAGWRITGWAWAQH